MNIPVAEDDENDFCLLELAFKRNSIPVSLKRVKDGQEAIDCLATMGPGEKAVPGFVPSLVLVDLNMPRANGFEVLRWVRDNPNLKRVVVVILSSSTDPRDVDLAYEMGANSYLIKTTSLEELTARMALVYEYWNLCCETPRLAIPPGKSGFGPN